MSANHNTLASLETRVVDPRVSHVVGEAALSTYLEKPFENVEVHGDVDKVPGGGDAVAEQQRSNWLASRTEILAMDSQTEGMNIQRVSAYAQGMGERDIAFKVLSPDDYRRAKALAGHNPAEQDRGRYFAEVDVVTVERDMRPGSADTLNGPEFTESLLVHELSHGKNQHHDVRLDVTARKGLLGRSKGASVQGTILRQGHIVRNEQLEAQGHYMEEALAEYERGQYIAKVLGRPTGFTDGLKPGTPMIWDKYTYKVENGGQTMTTVTELATPAATLELAIGQEPALLDVLRRGRHDTTALAEAEQLMDKVVPGLYHDMMTLDYAGAGDPAAEAKQTQASLDLFKKVQQAVARQQQLA